MIEEDGPLTFTGIHIQTKEVHDHLWLHSEFEDSLSYCYLKKTGSVMKAVLSHSKVLYIQTLERKSQYECQKRPQSPVDTEPIMQITAVSRLQRQLQNATKIRRLTHYLMTILNSSSISAGKQARKRHKDSCWGLRTTCWKLLKLYQNHFNHPGNKPIIYIKCQLTVICHRAWQTGFNPQSPYCGGILSNKLS